MVSLTASTPAIHIAEEHVNPGSYAFPAWLRSKPGINSITDWVLREFPVRKMIPNRTTSNLTGLNGVTPAENVDRESAVECSPPKDPGK